MTSELAHYLSVLLPSANVSLYVSDPALLKAAGQLKQDWRLARIFLDAQDGDVYKAIEYYSAHPSPDLLLIETKTIDDEFTAQLETLAGVCSEITAAIVIGPVNDVYLYRKLIDMGVNDYLVGPLSKDTLIDVIAKSLISRVGHSDSRLIAFVGAKGGIGTSTIAQYTALISAKTLEQKTLLLDVAGAWSFMPLVMGAEPSTSLAELCRFAVSADQDAFRRLIYHVDDKLSILPTGMEKLLDDSVPVEQFETLLNHLMLTYPVIIIDASYAPPLLRRLILNRAHHISIVTNPSLSSLRTARALMTEVKSLHDDYDKNIDILVNMVGMVKDHEVKQSDIENAIEKKPLGYIDYLPKSFVGAEFSTMRQLNDPALQEFFNLLTAFLRPLVGGPTGVVSKTVDKKDDFVSQFLSLLKIKK